MDNKNLPAYPDPRRGAAQSYSNQSPENEPQGFSKRELIAAMCLQGLLSASPEVYLGSDRVALSTQYADALLTHLENTSK